MKIRQLCLHNGISYKDKMTSFYRNRSVIEPGHHWHAFERVSYVVSFASILEEIYCVIIRLSCTIWKQIQRCFQDIQLLFLPYLNDILNGLLPMEGHVEQRKFSKFTGKFIEPVAILV